MEEQTEVEEVAKTGVRPDYTGDGVAIWKRKDKNKKTYLRLKILGGLFVNCFENNKKDKS